MITGLDLLFLEVNSLEESVAFYYGVLGMEIESINNETMLRRGRGVHFFIGVEDVDLFYDKLAEKGADVQPPVDEGWGGRFITLEDPDKYRYFFVTWMK
jgi:predicted enzyme related to lactoylglutathione lyase